MKTKIIIEISNEDYLRNRYRLFDLQKEILKQELEKLCETKEIVKSNIHIKIKR